MNKEELYQFQSLQELVNESINMIKILNDKIKKLEKDIIHIKNKKKPLKS